MIYVKGHGCPAILRVAAPPQWDPGRVDRKATRGEGNRWGVVTEVIGLHAVALDDAPTLDEISVTSTSVMQKGHGELEEWQYRLGEQLIAGASASSEDQRRAEQVPIEAGDVFGCDVAAPSDVRRAVRREARLVRSYEAYLNLRGEPLFAGRFRRGPRFSDRYNPGRDQVIEAKAHARRNDIRMAIGQLADYARFMTSSSAGRCWWTSARTRTSWPCSTARGSPQSGVTATASPTTPAASSRSRLSLGRFG